LALNSTKIALAFLSKLNADTYTRRCFEIPAAGAFMLAEYSDDLASLFAEGKEADYFRSPEEMMDKVRYYLRHETHRRRIASAGLSRVHLDGHEALDRARQIRDDVRRDLAEVRL
jgi:spore maturation protein CgeB